MSLNPTMLLLIGFGGIVSIASYGIAIHTRIGMLALFFMIVIGGLAVAIVSGWFMLTP